MTVPSYAAPGYPAPAPKTRPAVVTVASYLLYLVAAFEVINAILVFATLSKVKDALNDLYANTALNNDGGTIVAVAYSVGAVINVLFAVGFVLLGLLDGRGKNGARITTWVIGGISLCCVGAGLGSGAFTGSLGNSSGNRTGPTASEVQSRLADALPSWYTPVTTTITVLTLIAILGTIILLALPASNDFFRKPAPGWEGAVAYPGYPAPGQPGDRRRVDLDRGDRHPMLRKPGTASASEIRREPGPCRFDSARQPGRRRLPAHGHRAFLRCGRCRSRNARGSGHRWQCQE